MTYVQIPTLRPAADFDAKEDASTLRSAMKGLGTNEKKIIQILCNRSNDQRLRICTKYTEEYSRDLIKDLKSEISGDFRDLMVALLEPQFEYLAKQLHKSMSGSAAQKQTIVEILCSRNEQEVQSIVDAYEKLYERPLAEQLRKDTSEDFQRLLKRIVRTQGQRPTSTWEHVVEVATEKKQAGKDVETVPTFLAERLHTAMAGLGTDDTTLMLIIVSRCEIDLGNIKAEYARMYNVALMTAVKSDTSGDYQKALAVLIE